MLMIVLGDGQSTADGYVTFTVYIHNLSPNLSQPWDYSGCVTISGGCPSPSKINLKAEQQTHTNTTPN